FPFRSGSGAHGCGPHHRCKSRRLPRAFHVECRLRQVVPWVLSPVVVSEVLMQTCPWSPKVSGPRPEVSTRVRVPEALTSQACGRRWRGLRGCGAAEAPRRSSDLLEELLNPGAACGAGWSR